MAEPGMHDELRLGYETDAALIRDAMEAGASRILNAVPPRRTLRGVLAALPVLVGVAAAAVALGLVAGEGLDPLSLVTGIVVGGVVALLAARHMTRELAEANAAACGADGPLELVLSRDGVVETSGAAEIRVPWMPWSCSAAASGSASGRW
ncbi:hypothetical protein LNKW23_26710 [Paralimibaculum aggregatum]|uniref:Uncharacterized protein n=1 Tax=Paralimibaculum aggregatum TaxID=3036245 RepID=A0ABQ6LPY0_9RHOB|nr:hypothetical protein [Limibaculum sp. NKW23]GMG83458.1 hypothetical protein LNKW23_26710 [Limibaculum sp. NKW23]